MKKHILAHNGISYEIIYDRSNVSQLTVNQIAYTADYTGKNIAAFMINDEVSTLLFMVYYGRIYIFDADSSKTVKENINSHIAANYHFIEKLLLGIIAVPPFAVASVLLKDESFSLIYPALIYALGVLLNMASITIIRFPDVKRKKMWTYIALLAVSVALTTLGLFFRYRM